MTRERAAAALPALFAALLLTGCAPHPVPGPIPLRADANLRVMLSTLPASPRQMDPTRFTVTLRDAQGRLVSGATVRIDLRMPTMDMGLDEVALTPQSPGTYTGTGRFTMSGPWRATVAATRGSARTDAAVPITVR